MNSEPEAGRALWTSPHNTALPAWGDRTLVMGILNVTPDSFSDGGELSSLQAVVDRAAALREAGADVLDIGGESTRPGATEVGASEEMDRVLPSIIGVRKALPDAPLSIDTSKAEVARAAIRGGADIVNDVWGLAKEMKPSERQGWLDIVNRQTAPPFLPRSPMAETVSDLRCPVVIMHNRPDRNYGDFWGDVFLDLRLSLALAHNAGIPDRQIWLDPGFGFAKEPPHNLEVLKGLRRIVEFGYPVLLGTSRKSTIGLVTHESVRERTDGTVATIVWGIQQGCSMVRVHDVAAVRPAIRMADAIKCGLDWSEIAE